MQLHFVFWVIHSNHISVFSVQVNQLLVTNNLSQQGSNNSLVSKTNKSTIKKVIRSHPVLKFVGLLSPQTAKAFSSGLLGSLFSGRALYWRFFRFFCFFALWLLNNLHVDLNYCVCYDVAAKSLPFAFSLFGRMKAYSLT